MSEAPSPGAPGIGDPLYPELGNGGYRVEHYDLNLRYATAAPGEPMDGTVAIRARATQALSRFDLDFAGASVGSIEVDGSPAVFTRSGDELVITPAHWLTRGASFTVTVRHFQVTPAVGPLSPLGVGLVETSDGSVWFGQPDGAHRIFPSNDHPSNKATFAFRIDVPSGTTAVASGVLVDRQTIGDRSIWRYEQREAMATELAQVAVGGTVTARGVEDGVVVRDVTPTALTADIAPKLAIEIDQLATLRSLLGEFPFDSYGSLAVDSRALPPAALETQTLSLYDASTFEFLDASQYGPLMMHELSHQWFGDSVSPCLWSDVWLNEGHASWYENRYRYQGDPDGLVAQLKSGYASSDKLRVRNGPVAAPRTPDDVFEPNVYLGGELTLYALRQQVGDGVFQAIERSWVSTYRGRCATTEDFIELASRVAGQDLSAFLGAWLFDLETPPMPGHPDWTTVPVPAVGAAP